jgi:hypothetical protein
MENVGRRLKGKSRARAKRRANALSSPHLLTMYASGTRPANSRATAAKAVPRKAASRAMGVGGAA